jgi:hypothetical protein
VGLAGARRPEQDHVLAAVEEIELPQVLDHLLFHRALEGEVELLQALARREAGGPDPALAAVALARGDLGGEDGLEEALVRPALLPCPLGQGRHRPGRGGGLQGAEEVGEL